MKYHAKKRRLIAWVNAWIQEAGLHSIFYTHGELHGLFAYGTSDAAANAILSTDLCIGEYEDTGDEFPIKTYRSICAGIAYNDNSPLSPMLCANANKAWVDCGQQGWTEAFETISRELTLDERQARLRAWVHWWLTYVGLTTVHYDATTGDFTEGTRYLVRASMREDSFQEFPVETAKAIVNNIEGYAKHTALGKLATVSSRVAWDSLMKSLETPVVVTPAPTTTAVVPDTTPVLTLTTEQRFLRFVQWVTAWIACAGLTGKVFYDAKKGKFHDGKEAISYGFRDLFVSFDAKLDSFVEFPAWHAKHVTEMTGQYGGEWEIRNLLSVDSKLVWESLFPAMVAVAPATPKRKSPRPTAKLLESLRLLEETNFTITAKNPEDQPKLMKLLRDFSDLLFELTE